MLGPKTFQRCTNISCISKKADGIGTNNSFAGGQVYAIEADDLSQTEII